MDHSLSIRPGPLLLAAALILLSTFIGPKGSGPLVTPAWAQGTGPGADDPARKLERLRSQIRTEKSALSAVMKKEGGIMEKLSALQAQLSSTRRRLADLQKEREIIALESKELEAGLAALSVKVEAQRRMMAQRLRARYRFSRVGPLRVLFGAESMADLSRRRKNLEAISAADRRRMADFAILREQWSRARTQLRAKQESLAETEAVLNEQRAELSEDEAALAKMLKAIREEEATRREFLAELQADANRLGGVIADLDRKPRRRKEKPLPEKPPATEGQQAVVAEITDEQATAQAETTFPKLRGRLCAPAGGPITIGFGKRENPRFHTVTMQNGVEIGAAMGAPVRAVAPGVVRFAQWFRGYGNLVILEHDDGYYTVYAHLSSISAGVGEEVSAGQTIGHVGDTGSLGGASLYFEIRHHDAPLNPQEWLGGCKR